MEKLIALAESLAVALYDANAIDATAPTSDAFGSISEALQKVLVHIVGSKDEAERVYGFMIETQEPLRNCLIAGYDVTQRSFSDSWKVTNPEGVTIGRVYLDYREGYSPEPNAMLALPSEKTMTAAVFALVQHYRANR